MNTAPSSTRTRLNTTVGSSAAKVDNGRVLVRLLPSASRSCKVKSVHRRDDTSAGPNMTEEELSQSPAVTYRTCGAPVMEALVAVLNTRRAWGPQTSDWKKMLRCPDSITVTGRMAPVVMSSAAMVRSRNGATLPSTSRRTVVRFTGRPALTESKL